MTREVAHHLAYLPGCLDQGRPLRHLFSHWIFWDVFPQTDVLHSIKSQTKLPKADDQEVSLELCIADHAVLRCGMPPCSQKDVCCTDGAPQFVGQKRLLVRRLSFCTLLDQRHIRTWTSPLRRVNHAFQPKPDVLASFGRRTDNDVQNSVQVFTVECRSTAFKHDLRPHKISHKQPGARREFWLGGASFS